MHSLKGVEGCDALLMQLELEDGLSTQREVIGVRVPSTGTRKQCSLLTELPALQSLIGNRSFPDLRLKIPCSVQMHSLFLKQEILMHSRRNPLSGKGYSGRFAGRGGASNAALGK
jgi:hypothetical protein